jgi:serine/threonine protein kinase/tetratricopeptide (TPR) repeat protein
MSVEQNHSAGREERLGEILAKWLEAVEAGSAPDAEEFGRRYPEFADELREHLADWQKFPRLPAPAAPDEAARVLDDFELLRELGRGGMGVVFEARQLSLGRRVAVKILPLASTMDPRRLQRFKHEAQAAAQLDHPHIVHVYGVGCAGDVHYYAMQLIEGDSLAGVLTYLRRQRDAGPTAQGAPTIDSAAPTPDAAPAEATPPPDAAAAPSRPRPAPVSVSRSAASVLCGYGARRAEYFRTVAGWGIQAAEALEHAHQLGVVHRDVKPGNLLLDRGGQLWVTDFGLARFGRDGDLTRTGEIVGTLRYLSPEQALAKHGLVDHRADVYALGATLYELLTLRPAVEDGDCEEMLRRVVSEEPRPPRQHDRAIPRDLETITLKAMAKEPECRYATAREIADDLHRFLEQRPILARRPTFAQRVEKCFQRHRRLTASVLVLILVALAGFATSTALIMAEQSRTEIAKRDAENKKTLAEKRESEAKVQQARAEETLRTVLGLVQNQDKLLRIIRDNRQIKVDPADMAQWTGRFVKALQKLQEDRLNDPEHLYQLAVAQSSYGEVLTELGRFPEAESAYREAINLFTRVGTDFSTYPYAAAARLMCPSLHGPLAEVQRADGRLADAEASYHQGIQLNGTSTSMRLGDRLPADYLCGVARCLLAAGRIEEAASHYRRALELAPKLETVRIASAWFLATRPDADRKDLDRAIELATPLAGPNPTWNEAIVALGVAQYRAGDWKAAAATLARVAPLDRGPQNGAGFFQALAHWQLGERDKALGLYRQAVGWTVQYRPKDRELLRFSAEAARLLGLNEQIEFAHGCYPSNQWAAAVRYYSAAFTAEPKLADQRDPPHRFRAASAAALAGCGRGGDAGALDEKERARLRQQALDWLRADLKANEQELQKTAGRAGPAIAQRLQHWLKDMNLGLVRNTAALARLPEAEGQAWRALWAEVNQLLVQARGKETPRSK